MTGRLATVIAALLALPALAVAAEPKVRLTPSEIAALGGEAGGPGDSGKAGVTTTILVGDPSKPGPYTVRLRVPAHTAIQAHSHRDDRTGVVVQGLWRFGYGPVASSKLLKALPPGSVYSEPAGQPHFARTGDQAVSVIITGFGPTDTVYVDPRNDPARSSPTSP
jgi:quercetin dioxygenase-like cupin family protein